MPLQVLEEQVAAGRARAIGVSNYELSHLQQLLARAHIPPAVNQFEVHPRRPCTELRAACAAAGVSVVAYASLGCGELLQHPLVCQVAAAVHRTPAQVRATGKVGRRLSGGNAHMTKGGQGACGLYKMRCTRVQVQGLWILGSAVVHYDHLGTRNHTLMGSLGRMPFRSVGYPD